MGVDGRMVKVNQAVHGNDFWQTDFDGELRVWRVTYNVNLDSPGDRARPVRVSFGRR